MNRTPAARGLAGSASAVMLSALILFMSLVGASPALHKAIHADAGSAEHTCAFTLFAKGQIDSATVAPMVSGLLLAYFFVAILSESFRFPVANYLFSRGRAPPASAFHLN